jgi:site-specific DNA-methyltransferase (adenine-specific)
MRSAALMAVSNEGIGSRMTRKPNSIQKTLAFPTATELWNPEGIFFDDAPTPHFCSELGQLYADDCLAILPQIRDAVIDTVFADPPFNLGKKYGSKVNDSLSEAEYLDWCKRWLSECIRILKPGGSLFVYNLPKWNIPIGAFLSDSGMTFRHWIAVNIKMLLPIPGRLYPSHYSLLYYCKGPKPKTFRNIRTPIQVCRHCRKEIKDYGGHRDAMNPKGVNLTDVWDDVPPVRHAKFKSEKRKANQLSTKLVSRAVEMSTAKGDLVLDPFGGSGTTFDVCESRHRHWIGIELEDYDLIVDRLTTDTIAQHHFNDHVEE